MSVIAVATTINHRAVLSRCSRNIYDIFGVCFVLGKMQLLAGNPRVKRHLSRTAGIVIGTALFVALLSYGGIRLLMTMEARRVATFLTELHNIQLSDNENSVQPILRRYEDVNYEKQIGLDDGSHVLRVDPWHFRRPFGPNWIDLPIRGAIQESGGLRRRVGLRAWTVIGGLKIVNDRVESVSANLIVEGENEWLMAEWRYAADNPLQDAKRYKDHGLYRPEMERYLIRWTHLHMGPAESGEGIMNSFTPLAEAKEQYAAQNINLRCLTSLRGCRSLCDLMPDANRYRREHRYPAWGWNSGSWGPQGHSCD